MKIVNHLQSFDKKQFIRTHTHKQSKCSISYFFYLLRIHATNYQTDYEKFDDICSFYQLRTMNTKPQYYYINARKINLMMIVNQHMIRIFVSESVEVERTSFVRLLLHRPLRLLMSTGSGKIDQYHRKASAHAVIERFGDILGRIGRTR